MFLRSCDRKRGLTALIRFKGIVDFIPGKERRTKVRVKKLRVPPFYSQVKLNG